MTRLTERPVWQALSAHYQEISPRHMRDLFAEDPQRFDRFSLRFNNILLDYSKNIVTQQTRQLLLKLAEECKLADWIAAMFRGDRINHTEQRAVLHVALRNLSDQPMRADGQDVMPEVRSELQKMEALSEAVRSQTWRGATGQPIRDVVNIGIGGSDLGPEMVTEALRPYGSRDIAMHFVSNVDEHAIQDTLQKLDPATTLFIIASKTFTTQETMLNAAFARDWFLQTINDESALAKHFVAVTSNIPLGEKFGIDPRNIFAMWDWVGGRYSLWSAIGLSIAIYIGMDNFRAMLQGAHEMDQHFRTAPFGQNLPVILGLLGIWYNNYFGAQAYAILPYEQNLHRLPAYLQQADMESNGKCVDRDGNKVDYTTGPIIFGELGNPAQHAFYQLLHQGTKLIPADILAPIRDFHSVRKHHRALMSNVFAQTEALMKGKTRQEAQQELSTADLDAQQQQLLLPYKVFEGNKPTNTILFDTLDPGTLGSLLAMYEHKIFVQGVIWNINSFDQWGVELGKQLASHIFGELQDDDPVADHDCSTNGLINYYKTRRKILRRP
ncbi:MAG: glucose-6-phosphate isomerase [Proteobacteria bacterium]|jgi:glucose-6-phosphate isomerase|nr:glucose-6-phosphate isomerase [Pseudomonadota bacterium]